MARNSGSAIAGECAWANRSALCDFIDTQIVFRVRTSVKDEIACNRARIINASGMRLRKFFGYFLPKKVTTENHERAKAIEWSVASRDRFPIGVGNGQWAEKVHPEVLIHHC